MSQKLTNNFAVTYPPPEKADMCCSVCNDSESSQEQLAQLLGVGDRDFRSVNIWNIWLGSRNSSWVLTPRRVTDQLISEGWEIDSMYEEMSERVEGDDSSRDGSVPDGSSDLSDDSTS